VAERTVSNPIAQFNKRSGKTSSGCQETMLFSSQDICKRIEGWQKKSGMKKGRINSDTPSRTGTHFRGMGSEQWKKSKKKDKSPRTPQPEGSKE